MLHWFFQFAVVRVTPNMFISLDIWGAYVFWAAICAGSFLLLGLWAPEIKGAPMAQIDELFNGRVWTLWRTKVNPVAGYQGEQVLLRSESVNNVDSMMIESV